MRGGPTSSGDAVVRALAVAVIVLVLGALSFTVWIGLENFGRIGV